MRALKIAGVDPSDALVLTGHMLEDAEAARHAGIDSLELRRVCCGLELASQIVSPFVSSKSFLAE